MVRRLLASRFLLPLGGLLFVLGAKLFLIERLGSDVPVADQWTAEGSTLFQVQLHRGSIPFEHFLFPQGEHRPAMTRFWAYGLFRANGNQWDGRVQAVANLVFHAGTFLLLWFAAARFVPGGWLAVARLLTVALCALPANHENFVWGFQSQFLLLILCGWGHILGTMGSSRPDWRWAGAQLTGFVGVLSLASGFLSAVALAGLAVIEWLRGRRDAWLGATLLANGLLIAFGLWFLARFNDSPNHAHSVGEFLKAWLILLAWPFPQGWWGLLGQVPFLAAGFYALSRRTGTLPAALFLGLAAWFWLLLAALAYGRSGGGEMRIAVRYFDILVIGCWLNFVAALWLACALRRPLVTMGLALCLLPLVGGLAYLNRPAGIRSTLETLQLVRQLRDGAVRDFLATDNPAVFERYDWMQSTFPHLSYTIELLRDPLMRPALPPSLQPDGRAGTLSRGAFWLARHWWLVVVAGLASLMAGGWPLGSRPRPVGLSPG
jgi:hypothetical protein